MAQAPDGDYKRVASPFYSSLLPRHEHPEQATSEDGELIPTIMVSEYGGGLPVIPGLLGRQDPTQSVTWCVEQDTPTVPLAFHHWIEFPDHLVTVPEYNRLARTVGKRHVEPDDKNDLESAIGELISEITFPELKSHWRALADHLDTIIRTGTEYLKFARPSLKLDDKVAIVPAPITVLVSLLSCPDTASEMRASLRGVERTVEHCQTLRKLMEPKKGRKGPKGQPALGKLLAVVVNIAGDKLALPSNHEMEISNRATAILTLAREILDIACRVGTRALEQAAIPDDRRAKAIEKLRKMAKTPNRALSDHLRPIIKATNIRGG